MAYLLHIQVEETDALTARDDSSMQGLLEKILEFDGYFRVEGSRLTPCRYIPGEEPVRTTLTLSAPGNVSGILHGDVLPYIKYLDGNMRYSMRYLRKAGDHLEFYDPSENLSKILNDLQRIGHDLRKV
jgi:hypothetical protein